MALFGGNDIIYDITTLTVVYFPKKKFTVGNNYYFAVCLVYKCPDWRFSFRTDDDIPVSSTKYWGIFFEHCSFSVVHWGGNERAGARTNPRFALLHPSCVRRGPTEARDRSCFPQDALTVDVQCCSRGPWPSISYSPTRTHAFNYSQGSRERWRKIGSSHKGG